LDPYERPAQTPERADLLRCVVVQDVTHAATEHAFRAVVNVSAVVNCRFSGVD